MAEAEEKMRVDVLHVDDDDSWAGLVQRWLPERGMSVRRMRSGAETRRYLSTCSFLPRCLLFDISLGDDNGLALCDYVKTSPRLQILPIVALTAEPVSPVELLTHHVLYRVEKSGAQTEQELTAAIQAILTQQSRAQGVVDAGDLRLEPLERRVLLGGKEVARLTSGPFTALSLLVRSSPIPVDNKALYSAFISRRSYRSRNRELTVHFVLRSYISRLRRNLGRIVGKRIARAEAGYFYIPAG